ncbi:monocarboxylate transporter 13-like, partial [Pyrgilauda ruficollis]|uniref:monocarboxylate transporter 13-like n=1 Tax=Pyrgilauda ruficollis TaxID=221976 RepID=UPI001B8744CD
LGWSLAFTPALGAVSRWFPRRRALATGLTVSGAAVSGLALAPLVPLALDTYGWRGALLLLAAVSLHLVAAAALLRPPRAPPEPPEPPGGLAALLRLLRPGPFLRHLALPLGRSFGALAALAAAYGGCAGAVAPLQFAGVAEVVGAGRAALAIGVMQMFESVGSLLGAPLAEPPV